MTKASVSAPALAIRDLWQVFGEGGAAACQTHQDLGVSDRAKALRAGGLTPAVAGATFEVAHGETFVIMGLSGSGKSTLIRSVSRLLDPSCGTIEIDGEDITHASERRLLELRRRKMGMVFQHFGLFPHMTVRDNVAFPLKMQGVDRATRHAAAAEVIDLVGLTGREMDYPRALSGGQRQRVGIARSLAIKPDLWFLDEPFSALDPLIRRQLQDEFLDIQARLQKTILFITHDITEALRLADRIAIMRDGCIVQIGTPAEIILTPADDYVRAFARDIPKGRHMTLASVMSDIDPAHVPAGAGAFTPDMTLEAALAQAIGQMDPLILRDPSGAAIGQVAPDQLIHALGTQE